MKVWKFVVKKRIWIFTVRKRWLFIPLWYRQPGFSCAFAWMFFVIDILNLEWLDYCHEHGCSLLDVLELSTSDNNKEN